MKRIVVATVVFTYDRPKHTKLVLDALRKNTVLPEKLIIFQDGKKENTDVVRWNAVNQLIRTIEWCDTEIIISLFNKGLAKSISQGVTEVLKRYDAVIVLEDDCVTHPGFMRYMINALNKYMNRGEVYHINGYAWDVEVKPNGYDAYFGGRIGSWGWATWKTRWEVYNEDYKVFSRIKKDDISKRQLDIWGPDLEGHLLGNVNGICDSWAVFWALLVIEHHGFCVTPYKSLIDNIGLDGTGVHCGISKAKKTRMYELSKKEDLQLPEKVEFPLQYEIIFPKVFKWVSQEKKLRIYNQVLLLWLQLKVSGKSFINFFHIRCIKSIAIWGTGKICDLLLEELKNKISIVCLLESDPNVENYRNIPVRRIEDLDEEVEFVLIIPIYDKADISEKLRTIGFGIKFAGIDDVIMESLAGAK